MTVKLLSAWGDFPINALYTADAATEAAMVAQKVATTDLAGGVAWPLGQAPQSRGLESVEQDGVLVGFADSVGDRLVIGTADPVGADGRPDRTIYIQIGGGLFIKENGSYEQSAGGGGGPSTPITPVVITTSITLTEADHANRELEVNSPTAITLTLPATATPGFKFFGTNMGAGALTIVTNGGGAVPGNAILPATLDQFSAFEVKRQTASFVRVA